MVILDIWYLSGKWVGSSTALHIKNFKESSRTSIIKVMCNRWLLPMNMFLVAYRVVSKRKRYQQILISAWVSKWLCWIISKNIIFILKLYKYGASHWGGHYEPDLNHNYCQWPNINYLYLVTSWTLASFTSNSMKELPMLNAKNLLSPMISSKEPQ